MSHPFVYVNEASETIKESHGCMTVGERFLSNRSLFEVIEIEYPNGDAPTYVHCKLVEAKMSNSERWREGSSSGPGQCQAIESASGKQCVHRHGHGGSHASTFGPSKSAMCQACTLVWTLDQRDTACPNGNSHIWIDRSQSVVLTSEQALTALVALAFYRGHLASRAVDECPVDELGEALRSVESTIRAIDPTATTMFDPSSVPGKAGA